MFANRSPSRFNSAFYLLWKVYLCVHVICCRELSDLVEREKLQKKANVLKYSSRLLSRSAVVEYFFYLAKTTTLIALFRYAGSRKTLLTFIRREDDMYSFFLCECHISRYLGEQPW